MKKKFKAMEKSELTDTDVNLIELLLDKCKLDDHKEENAENKVLNLALDIIKEKCWPKPKVVTEMALEVKMLPKMAQEEEKEEIRNPVA